MQSKNNITDRIDTLIIFLLEQISLGLIIIGAIGIVAGPAIFVWQCYLWLKFDFWTPVEISRLWSGQAVPSTGWLGVDKIIQELVGMPLSFSVFMVGIGVLGAGVAIHEHWGRSAPATE